MKTTKKYLKGLLNSIKLILNLTSLKEEEVAGKFSRKTYLRLFPKWQPIFLPIKNWIDM